MRGLEAVSGTSAASGTTMASERTVSTRRAFSRLLKASFGLLLAASVPLAAAEPGDVSIRADVPESGAVGARTDTPLRLVAQLEVDGVPAAARTVKWTLE